MRQVFNIDTAAALSCSTQAKDVSEVNDLSLALMDESFMGLGNKEKNKGLKIPTSYLFQYFLIL